MVFKPKKKFEEVEEYEEELEVPTPEPVRKPVNKAVVQNQEEILWTAEEIPTATSTVIYNSKTGKTYSLMEAIAEILNRSEN